MYLGENLQTLRKMKNMSQEQLAEKLGISRQAISKWESGSGYPETDKIIAICDLFGCSMDELVKGKISIDSSNEKRVYDNLINKFSKMVSIGVGLILLGSAVLILLSGITNNEVEQEKYALIGVCILLVFITISVSLFIISGTELENYKKKNIKLPKFYTEEDIDKYNKKFPIFISIGVGLILIGVVAMLLLIGLNIFDSDSTIPVSIFMLFLTIAVPVLIYSGIQKDKFDIDKYNKENSDEARSNDDKKGKICGIIMMISTIIYFLISFVFQVWEYSWIVFPIGGILCGIVSTIMDKN